MVGHGRAYLLLRHARGGHWSFPKGHVEPRETPRRAALRELREETGIRHVRFVAGFLAHTEYEFALQDTRVRKRVAYFLGQARPTGLQLSAEHGDCAWLPYAEARRRITYESDRGLLQKAERLLQSRPS